MKNRMIPFVLVILLLFASGCDGVPAYGGSLFGSADQSYEATETDTTGPKVTYRPEPCYFTSISDLETFIYTGSENLHDYVDYVGVSKILSRNAFKFNYDHWGYLSIYEIFPSLEEKILNGYFEIYITEEYTGLHFKYFFSDINMVVTVENSKELRGENGFLHEDKNYNIYYSVYDSGYELPAAHIVVDGYSIVVYPVLTVNERLADPYEYFLTSPDTAPFAAFYSSDPDVIGAAMQPILDKVAFMNNDQ